MTTILSLNRAFLRWARPLLHWQLFTVIFPALADNTNFPGAPALITIITNLWTTFYVQIGLGNTVAADIIYQNILNAVVDLMNYCVTAAGNDIVKLTSSKFKLNKTTKTANPQTAVPTNLRFMVLGDGNFLVKAIIDEYCHILKARTRLKGAPDSAWVINEVSQNDTVHFTGYVHNTDEEVQLQAIGTAGPSEWSASVFVPVD
jgi:hypothetical protein